MTDVSIEWTDKAWNPVRGCSRVSEGCRHCYAERVAARFSGPGQPYEGLVRLSAEGKHGRPRWNGTVRLVPEHLGDPLRWRKPQRVFVNSMSDLFHEGVPDDFIAAVFGVMAAAPQHTFQILTKRPERAREWFGWYEGDSGAGASPYAAAIEARSALAHAGVKHVREALSRASDAEEWPLPNVHLGVSVEDQATADARIPRLLECPAALRFVSYEPALGPVSFGTMPGIDWVIVGGESGPGARSFDVAWARSTIAQCRQAGVPVFVKQLGAVPHVGDGGAGWAHSSVSGRHWRMDDPTTDPLTVYEVRDRKGGDMSEWPEDLRVREMPEAEVHCG